MSTSAGSGRDRAIEAAARAWWENGETTATFKRWENLDDRGQAILRDAMAAALAAAVPGLLNDLADSIEKQRDEYRPQWDLDVSTPMEHKQGMTHAASLVRAAAEGWGEA